MFTRLGFYMCFPCFAVNAPGNQNCEITVTMILHDILKREPILKLDSHERYD